MATLTLEPAKTISEDSPADMNTVDVQQLPSTESPDNDQSTEKEATTPETAKPFTIYTRSQILYLSKSHLVGPPPDMPELKDWFGIELDAIHKKDVEPTTPGARERRFRRDADDGETPSRPTFRSALSQPSQMGNFKHQSVRAERDRDRDRDTDKDRERDIRDKEGQERLRHLSDKYDRERLAFPANVGSRTKERDIAPHLAAGPSTRTANQTSPATRRAEGAKKKAGEVSEDWRKAADIRFKDEKSDASRKDKDERVLGEEEDVEQDDPRRWRDDGKRNERMTARREKTSDKDRVRERVPHDADSADRRWTVVEERDARTKRSSGRERRVEEAKDDRKEREREKEPAWMDAYIPSNTAGSGILGAKTDDGELDGIQAWKKGIKEKEDKEREKAKKVSADPGEPQLDEIQLFKLMMRKEEKKKQTGLSSEASTPTEPIRGHIRVADSSPQPSQSAASGELSSLLGILSVSSGQDPVIRPTADARTTSTSRLFPDPLPQNNSFQVQAADRNPLEVPAQFNPPQGSRLLAFGSRASSAAKVPTVGSQPAYSNGLPAAAPVPANMNALRSAVPQEVPRVQRGFSPLDPSRAHHEEMNAQDIPRRSAGERPSYGPEHTTFTEPGLPANDISGFQPKAGSRFAKFFDGKSRDGGGQPLAPQKVPSDFISPSPTIGGQRYEQNDFSEGGHTDQRAIDDIFAMLNNSSSQNPRVNPSHVSPAGNVGFRQTQVLTPQQQHLLQQQQQQQHVLSNGRLEALYESRLDDRNFTPDGMVPGLRSIPAPRSRDNAGMYELPDDSMHYSNGQRLPQPQQRTLEQMYSGHVPPMYAQQAAAVRGLGNQPQYRGGPSPNSGLQQNRIPAGLANLGGRPPHEPQQVFSYNNNPSLGPQPQQAFNNFAGVPPPQVQNFNHFNAGVPFAGQQQMRHAPMNHNLQPLATMNRIQQQTPLMRQQQLQQLQAQQQLQQQQLHQQQTAMNHSHIPQNAELIALLMGSRQ